MFSGAGDGTAGDAGYAVIGAPLESSSSFYPGSRFGPDRIRHFARGFEDYDHRTGRRFTEQRVVDLGDVRAWQDTSDYLDFLAGELGDVVDDGAVPLLLGGEHTVSIAGVRATRPEVYVCIDAHLDLRETYDGNRWSHATTVHHALNRADEALLFGVRAGSERGWERADELETVTVVEPADTDPWLASRLDEYLAGRSAYLSIDVDGIDPAFAPATGTREPFGLHPDDVRTIVREVAAHAAGIDVVEVTDRDQGQTATLAAKLLRDFVFTHATET